MVGMLVPPVSYLGVCTFQLARETVEGSELLELEKVTNSNVFDVNLLEYAHS